MTAVALASLAVWGVATAAQQAGVAAHAEINFEKSAPPLRFELFRGNRIFFEGTVNGRRAMMMLDSGASSSVLNTRFAAEAGVTGGTAISARGASGESDARQVDGVAMQIGGLSIGKTTVIVLDLAEIERGIGHRIDAVVGRDAFEAGVVDIDFERREIDFRSADGFIAPPGATRVPMTLANGLRQIPIAIGGRKPIMADFDLGSGTALILAQPDWQQDPELAGLRAARARAGGVGGHSDKRAVTLPSVTVGGYRFDRVPALLNTRAEDLPTEGANIGADLLQRFHLAIDFRRGALYLTPIAAQIAQPLPKDRLGMRTEFAGDALKVVYVSPDGPAATAGWKEGDRIVAIGDVKVGPDFFRSQYANFTRLAPGTQLDFVGADGVRKPVVLKDFF